eukprot:CAMPEP_0115488574 /NCGR_PEP_ID=MMETSP0271-20121206/61552_1 /TAXON_ID=71861 /ORGANISM="Scrippsiella trochoidea, Strain CCMP3099" /LENGTH=57 /DNA_ID=CAMNT_0002916681 /DNA_START=9 /DNA_END=178 /DNA_ORIENTATION=-
MSPQVASVHMSTPTTSGPNDEAPSISELSCAPSPACCSSSPPSVVPSAAPSSAPSAA